MRIIILGASGALGTELKDVLRDYDVYAPSRTDLDITDYGKISKKLHEADPEIVISTVAYHDMDKCEKNPKKAFELNAFATKNLAEVCLDVGATLVWISTNYVFSGEDGPYSEERTPDPISVYGISKLLGEHFIKNILEDYYIVRTAGLFGPVQSECKSGKNLIDTLKGLDKVKAKTDEFFTMSYTPDCAEAIHEMMLSEEYGIHHLFNKGRHTVYEIAKHIRPDVEKAKRADFDDSPIYPKDATLSTLRKIEIPEVLEAIERHLYG